MRTVMLFWNSLNSFGYECSSIVMTKIYFIAINT